MENRDRYVVQSLELHLFFARIMKEHALFLEAGFPPPNAEFARRADTLKREFESLLLQAIRLSDGVVGREVLCSGEVCTDFTAVAERQTQRLTGIRINGSLTALAARLRGTDCPDADQRLVCRVRQLNRTALRLLDGLIRLKEQVLSDVCACRMFTVNYPLLIEHILREAKLYRTFVAALEDGRGLDCQTMRETERFWDQIMMEHAQFIRGLLDPTECELIAAANGFAEDFSALLAASCECQDKAMGRDAARELTCKLRDFKAAGAKGIQDCRIRSIILPLLADHVLREANHYLRLLDEA